MYAHTCMHTHMHTHTCNSFWTTRVLIFYPGMSVSSQMCWSHVCLPHVSTNPQVRIREATKFMSAAEIASRGAAESAADKAYQEQLLDSQSRPRGPHPMLRQVRSLVACCSSWRGTDGVQQNCMRRPPRLLPSVVLVHVCAWASVPAMPMGALAAAAAAVQVAGGVDTGVERLGLSRPQEQMDEQTRRFREQVCVCFWGGGAWRVAGCRRRLHASHAAGLLH